MQRALAMARSASSSRASDRSTSPSVARALAGNGVAGPQHSAASWNGHRRRQTKRAPPPARPSAPDQPGTRLGPSESESRHRAIATSRPPPRQVPAPLHQRLFSSLADDAEPPAFGGIGRGSPAATALYPCRRKQPGQNLPAHHTSVPRLCRIRSEAAASGRRGHEVFALRDLRSFEFEIIKCALGLLRRDPHAQQSRDDRGGSPYQRLTHRPAPIPPPYSQRIQLVHRLQSWDTRQEFRCGLVTKEFVTPTRYAHRLRRAWASTCRFTRPLRRLPNTPSMTPSLRTGKTNKNKKKKTASPSPGVFPSHS